MEPGTHDTATEADRLAQAPVLSKTQADKDRRKRAKAHVLVEHLDIIRDDFWERRPWLLSNKPGRSRKET